MREKIILRFVRFTLFCTVFLLVQVGQVYGETAAAIENQWGAGKTAEREIVLEDDAYIGSMIYSFGDGSDFPQDINWDGEIELAVPVGMDIGSGVMPTKVWAWLTYKNLLDDYGGNQLAEEAICNMRWDPVYLHNITQIEGIYKVQGEWIGCEADITGGVLDLEMTKPICKLIVEKPEPVLLPKAAFVFKTEFNEGASRNIYVSRNKKTVTIAFNERLLVGTEFSLEVRKRGEAIPLELTVGEDYEIRDADGTLYNIKFMNFFEEGEVYDVVLNTMLGGSVYTSDMILDATLEGESFPGLPNPPEGETGNPDDGSSTIPRDGGGRDTQGSIQKREFTTRDIQTLIKADKKEQILILDGISVELPISLLDHWYAQNATIGIQVKRMDGGKFQLETRASGELMGKLPYPIKIKIPVDKDNKFLDNMSKTQRETELVLMKEGKVISNAYFDGKTNEIIASITEQGLFEASTKAPRAFNDTKGHDYEAVIDFASARNIICGYEDGNFKPDKKISDAELNILFKRTGVNRFKNDKNLSRGEALNVLINMMKIQ